MFKFTKTFITTLLIAVFLSACSSVSLQNKRLDTAELNLIQAEQALAATQVSEADSSLGTANAYLATVSDYKKFLTPDELNRYQQIKQRANILTREIMLRK